MGISFVSKVAPPKYKGLMMGGWFVATAIGNKLVGVGGYACFSVVATAAFSAGENKLNGLVAVAAGNSCWMEPGGVVVATDGSFHGVLVASSS